jgi:hypothetical protein
VHEDFPTDPATLTILVISVAAGAYGYTSDGLNQAFGFFAGVLIVGLLSAWTWYSVKGYTDSSR